MKRFIVVSGLIIGLLVFGAYSLRAWPHRIAEFLRYGYVLPANVDRRIAIINDRQVAFLVVRPSSDSTWHLASDPSAPKSVHEWRTSLDASLVINGSYFTEKNEPTGYYSIDGEANRACPMFSSDGDVTGYTFGVAINDGKIDVAYLPSDPAFCGELMGRNGLASFPTLIIDGSSAIVVDSGLMASRTMLAKGENGEVDIILTESGQLSLFEVAQWLDVQSENYSIAGNLDGGTSTGLSMKADRWSVEVPSFAVPNVIFLR